MNEKDLPYGIYGLDEQKKLKAVDLFDFSSSKLINKEKLVNKTIKLSKKIYYANDEGFEAKHRKEINEFSSKEDNKVLMDNYKKTGQLHNSWNENYKVLHSDFNKFLKTLSEETNWLRGINYCLEIIDEYSKSVYLTLDHRNTVIDILLSTDNVYVLNNFFHILESVEENILKLKTAFKESYEKLNGFEINYISWKNNKLSHVIDSKREELKNKIKTIKIDSISENDSKLLINFYGYTEQLLILLNLNIKFLTVAIFGGEVDEKVLSKNNNNFDENAVSTYLSTKEYIEDLEKEKSDLLKKYKINFVRTDNEFTKEIQLLEKQVNNHLKNNKNQLTPQSLIDSYNQKTDKVFNLKVEWSD